MKYNVYLQCYYNGSGFYLRSEVLGSHTEYNPICNSIKVCTKTRLGLDYNFPWGEAPYPEKVPRSGTRVCEWSRRT
jgi:hypothetical protein